ncbi:MAG: hypothetical protein FJX77_05240 [Armatimonadetes bacterium]|nr:hypothetical protein [Armatimonadota bacterium]
MAAGLAERRPWSCCRACGRSVEYGATCRCMARYQETVSGSAVPETRLARRRTRVRRDRLPRSWEAELLGYVVACAALLALGLAALVWLA